MSAAIVTYGGRGRVASRVLTGAIRTYQGLRAGRPSPCRYVPSCSSYAVEAIERFGAARGVWLGVRRLARCHPWGGFGADPVPDRPDVGESKAGEPGIDHTFPIHKAGPS